MNLPQRIDLVGRLPGLQELPILLQLRAVDLRPSLDETALWLGQAAAQAFDRVDREDSRILLVKSVKVSVVMLHARFNEHTDDDSEEPRQFWHLDRKSVV